MTSHRCSKRNRKPNERGQAIVFVVLAMGLVLLGAVAFSVDMGNLWFHRQSAQTVADASCAAAAMDMLFTTNGGGAKGGFTPGTNFSCSGSPSAAPCVYATKNMGYAPSTLAAGTPGYDAAFTFPTSVTGLPTCTTGTGAPAVCNDTSALTNNFVQVNVDDRVRLSFAGLLSGSTTTDVGAVARCGVVLANSPIPILVLDPRNETSLDNNGNFSISVVGGPQRSIQVNSSSSSAVSIAGASGNFDLTKGGPDLTGSDFGVTGSEGARNFTTGATGQWVDPTPAISDPFATIPAPAQPGLPVVPVDLAGNSSCNTSAKIAAGNCSVATGIHGCPDTTCTLYAGGFYSGGITVKHETAIFDPGVYYVNNGLALQPLSCVRPSTAVGDGSGGTMFYFADTNTVSVTSNSGASCPAAQVSLAQVRCTPATVLPANVIANGGLSGNVLLGPCNAPTGGGTNYGDPLGTNDPLGEQRGMLFFQNRSANLAAAGNQPNWDGGGSFGLTGLMYFHYCNSADGAGLGTHCNAAAYTDQLSLQGGSCSSTFVIGDVVVDKLHLGGNPCIEMDLNPNALFYVTKASLLP
jgi:Putative Flp pilus-assembly TadE/G-like